MTAARVRPAAGPRVATLGSLFSGVEGFGLAAGRVGMRVAWHSEIEPYACKVLAHRFPDVPNLGDVTTLTDAPPVDVITAGFPCQDLSVAGKQAGLHGARSGLFFEIVRVVGEMREATGGRSPAFLVLENVPGLLTSHRGRDFAVVLGALGGLGPLDIAWRVLDAQHFGVPQRRRRVFVVCDFAGRRAAEILALSEGGARHPAPRRAQGQATATTLGSRSHSPGVSYPGRGGEDDDNLILMDAVAPCDTGRYGKGAPTKADDALIFDQQNSAVVGTVGTLQADGMARQDRGFLVADLAQITSAANRSRVEEDRPSSTLASNSQMIAFHTLQDPISGAVSPAMGTGTKAGYASIGVQGAAGGIRRLTPVECERLQGFPDGWTCLHDHPQPCDCPDGARYRCLGNAVAVPVAQWLLGRVMDALEVPA